MLFDLLFVVQFCLKHFFFLVSFWRSFFWTFKGSLLDSLWRPEASNQVDSSQILYRANTEFRRAISRARAIDSSDVFRAALWLALLCTHSGRFASISFIYLLLLYKYIYIYIFSFFFSFSLSVYFSPHNKWSIFICALVSVAVVPPRFGFSVTVRSVQVDINRRC